MISPTKLFPGILVFLLGFVFPLFFIIGIAIIYSEVEDHRIRKLAGPKSSESSLSRISSEDCMKRFRRNCESPAELSFLTAMISNLNLVPGEGLLQGALFLQGENLKLQMQTEIHKYRVDFLIDGKLVVEVDGAAWHSSAEAIERDRVRDAYLRSKGYEVLRIPAKVTLYSPHEAVRLVQIEREKLSELREKKIQEDTEASRALGQDTNMNLKHQSLKDNTIIKLEGFTNGLNSFRSGLDEVVQELQRRSAESSAGLGRATERRLKEIQEQLYTDPKRRAIFEELRLKFEENDTSSRQSTSGNASNR